MIRHLDRTLNAQLSLHGNRRSLFDRSINAQSRGAASGYLEPMERKIESGNHRQFRRRMRTRGAIDAIKNVAAFVGPTKRGELSFVSFLSFPRNELGMYEGADPAIS